MSKFRTIILALLLTMLAVLAAACVGSVEREDPSAAYTAGASTLIARLTMEAGGTAVAQLTQMSTQNAGQPSGPRLTPPPKEPLTATPTFTPIPTDTTAPRPPAEVEEPSPTPVPPTPTAVSAPCNRMALLGDVTVPTDSIFPAGTVINKVWRVQNIGSCTWTPAYNLIFTGGNLSSAQVTALPAVTAPGQTVDLSVALIAPGQAGIYQGTWMLRSDTGEVFGAGADASVPLFARIQVPQAVVNPPVSGYDIAVNYCAGRWSSVAGVLFCPGNPDDDSGSVILVQTPNLEDRRASGYGLWTRPNLGSGGWISGEMPLLSIRSGDHFVAEIGCLANSPECDVIFQLDYRTAGGATGRLGRWRETSDSLTTLVDLDLSALSGRNVSLILSVFNRGRGRDANAFWLLPRVEQQSSAPRANTLTWTRDGLPDEDSCDELHVYHTATNSFTAVAYDCSFGLVELGRMTLSAAQVDQMRAWEARLNNAEGEVYSASGGNPVTSWVVFRGSGRATASDGDIHSLESFAAQIFYQITH